MTRIQKSTINRIKSLLCSNFDVSFSELSSRERQRRVARPRQIGMFLARELTDYSLKQVGRFFGGRDHTTVIHAVDKITRMIKFDSKLRIIVEGMRNEAFCVLSCEYDTLRPHADLALDFG